MQNLSWEACQCGPKVGKKKHWIEVGVKISTNLIFNGGISSEKENSKMKWLLESQ